MQLANLRGVADNIDGDPPRATVEREASPEETVHLTNQCMEESGFVVIDGAIEVPPEQEQAYWRAMYTCRVRYPAMDRYLQPLTDQQWITRYTHWTDELIPCLAGEGLALETGPPTLEVFLSDPFAWRPWRDELPGLSAWRDRTGLANEDLEQRCPYDPPLEALYPPE